MRHCEALWGTWGTVAEWLLCEALRGPVRHCEVLRSIARHCGALWLSDSSVRLCEALRGTAKHCEALRGTAGHCEALWGWVIRALTTDGNVPGSRQFVHCNFQIMFVHTITPLPAQIGSLTVTSPHMAKGFIMLKRGLVSSQCSTSQDATLTNYGLGAEMWCLLLWLDHKNIEHWLYVWDWPRRWLL